MKNYNQLIGNNFSAHRYLFVLDIPANNSDWYKDHSGSITLKNRCYWMSLHNLLPTKNRASVAIHIPNNQILTPDGNPPIFNGQNQ